MVLGKSSPWEIDPWKIAPYPNPNPNHNPGVDLYGGQSFWVKYNTLKYSLNMGV